MIARVRFAAAACSLVAAALLFLPSTADAQGRRSPRVVRHSTVVVGGGFYYSPYFYNPWYPYYYGWYPQYPGYPGYGYGYDDSAALRLQVTPRQTEVFIDGYYAGTVDDFDGMFQRLNLEAGEHDLQLYLAGHRSVTQKIYLQRNTTFRVRHTMEALGAGEAEPVRPAVTAPPTAQPRPAQPPTSGGRPGQTARRPDPGGPQAAQSTYGTLALRVQPGDAAITIDGEKWEGPSGADRLEVQLAPGTHVVEVRKDGYRSYMSEVTVRSADTATLNIALARQ